MQILLSGSHAAPDVPLGFVYVQDDAGLGSQGRIDVLKPVRNILMYRGLADSELLCRAPHRSVVFYDIIGDFHGPFLNIVLQETPLNSLFLQSMRRCGAICDVINYKFKVLLFTHYYPQIYPEVHARCNTR